MMKQGPETSARRTTQRNTTSDVPPWKRKTKQATDVSEPVDIVVAAPHRLGPLRRDRRRSPGFVKSSAPFTFQGDRGGIAEDAELLAELKAISAGASSRFASDDACESDGQTNPSQGAVVNDEAGAKTSARRTTQRNTASDVPPWKRKTKQATDVSEPVDIVVAAPPPPRPLRRDRRNRLVLSNPVLRLPFKAIVAESRRMRNSWPS
jgi:cytoskeleton-associated protein 5